MTTETINRADLRSFFQPHADLAHMDSERVHIHCSLPAQLGNQADEYAHHRSGYVCGVTDGTVSKTNGRGPDAIAFDTINRVTVHDIDGKMLREYRVVDKETVT